MNQRPKIVLFQPDSVFKTWSVLEGDKHWKTKCGCRRRAWSSKQKAAEAIIKEWLNPAYEQALSLIQSEPAICLATPVSHDDMAPHF